MYAVSGKKVQLFWPQLCRIEAVSYNFWPRVLGMISESDRATHIHHTLLMLLLYLVKQNTFKLLPYVQCKQSALGKVGLKGRLY